MKLLLILIPLACLLLIFLDYHQSRNIHKSIIYTSVLISTIVLMGFAVKILQFDLLYLMITVPLVLFIALFVKNRKKNEVDF